MVVILSTDTREQQFTLVRFAIPIGVGQDENVRGI